MEDKIQHSKPVPPFVRFCAANIPMVFDDSLSYYECLCALWKWLQTDVINVINNNATVTQKWREELTEFEDDMTDKFDDLNDAFDTLKNWVEDYFDNLDVQEEINNKLDQMAEDGTLEEIMAHYLEAKVAWTFDTVAEMKASVNLVNGSYARTLGFHTINDGGGGLYKITNTGTANEMNVIAVGSLYANLIYGKQANIRQFGAYGDGTHDDTLCVKTAVETCNSIYVPIGQYVITDTIFIPSDVDIIGEKSNTFFDGYEDGATILYQNVNLANPCFSFLGKDRNGLNHKDIYVITGAELDNGDYDQTVASSLQNINIVSEDSHNVGIVFSGCPTSKIIGVSIRGFIAGIIASATWNSVIEKSFIYTNYCIIANNNCNNVSVNDCYIHLASKDYTVDNTNSLYTLVTSNNLYNKNKTSGILGYFVYNFNINNCVIEHGNIGINLGAQSFVNINNVWLEDNNTGVTSYTGNVNGNRLYLVPSATATDYALQINNTNFNLNSSNSLYNKLLTIPENRAYTRIYIKNVSDKNNHIADFNLIEPEIIYVDTNGTSNASGLKSDPVNDLTQAISFVKDNGTIFFLSDFVLPTDNGGVYLTINKKITFKSDSGDKKTLTPRVGNDNRILPIRYLNDLCFKDVNINITLPNASVSDSSLSGLFNPFDSSKKEIRFISCTINTKTNYGLLVADYGRNTYTDLVFETCSFTGSCEVTRNHANGSSKKLSIKEYTGRTTFEVTKVYGTQTTVVETYTD